MKLLFLVMLLAAPAAAQPRPCPAHPVIMGCANAANLAAMVVSPADLVMPQASPPASGPAQLLAIERYRSGKILALPNSGTDGSADVAPPQ